LQLQLQLPYRGSRGNGRIDQTEAVSGGFRAIRDKVVVVVAAVVLAYC
jgi:hypothetical protein